MTRSARLPRRPVLARRGLAGGAAALVLLLGSACGGGSEDADSSADPAASGTSAEASPGSDETTDTDDTDDTGETLEGESVDPEEFVELFQAAITQEETARVDIETVGIGGGVTGSGDIDTSTSPPTLALTLDLQGQEAELRLVDGIAYVQVPQTGGKFLELDLSDPNNPLGASIDQFDIESQFEAFGDAIEEVVRVGTEEVDGEQLERYTLTVDGEAVAEQAAGTGLEAGAGQLPDELVYDVYLDGAGLFRTLTFDLDELGVSSTVSYSDWGKDVSITAPKPSETTSLPGS